MTTQISTKPVDIAAVLRRTTKKAGVSKVDIIVSTGAHPTTIDRWFEGEREPGAQHLIILMRIIPGFAEALLAAT